MHLVNHRSRFQNFLILTQRKKERERERGREGASESACARAQTDKKKAYVRRNGSTWRFFFPSNTLVSSSAPHFSLPPPEPPPPPSSSSSSSSSPLPPSSTFISLFVLLHSKRSVLLRPSCRTHPNFCQESETPTETENVKAFFAALPRSRPLRRLPLLVGTCI